MKTGAQKHSERKLSGLSEEGLSRRESNKRDKLQRIRQAAKEVFLEKGYDAATGREIAAKANVAFGTLFLYAKNKQDLLLLLFDEELPRIRLAAEAKVVDDKPIIDQIIDFFLDLYHFFAKTPKLSRDMLREITFSSGGIVAGRMWDEVQQLEHHLALLIARAQSRGAVSLTVSPDLAAHVIFNLHRVEIRLCMDGDEPDIRASLDNFRRQLEVVFVGLQVRENSPPA